MGEPLILGTTLQSFPSLIDEADVDEASSPETTGNSLPRLTSRVRYLYFHEP